MVPATAPDRLGCAPTAAGAAPVHRSRTGGGSARPSARRPRCHVARALCPVGQSTTASASAKRRCRGRWRAWAGRSKKSPLRASEHDATARARGAKRLLPATGPPSCSLTDAWAPHGANPPARPAPRGQRAIGRAPRNRGRPDAVCRADACGDGTGLGRRGRGRSRGVRHLHRAGPGAQPAPWTGGDHGSAQCPHRRQHPGQGIEAAGCELRLLPAYSPDFRIRSRRPSPRSKPTCAAPKPAPSQPWSGRSAPPSTGSPPPMPATATPTVAIRSRLDSYENSL